MEARHGHHPTLGDLVDLSRLYVCGIYVCSLGARLQGDAARDGRAIPRHRPVWRCDAGGGGKGAAVVRRRPPSHHTAQSERRCPADRERPGPPPPLPPPTVPPTPPVAYGSEPP